MIRARRGGRHSFPHKRIKWSVTTARKRHTCDTVSFPDPPDGHRHELEPGDPYVRVAIMPSKRDPRGGWHHAKLCPGCAIHYGLAELEHGAQDERPRAFRRAGLDEIADDILEELRDS